jgi:long-chain acyl-CoA synthetase
MSNLHDAPQTDASDASFVAAPARFLATAARLGEEPAYFVRDKSGWRATSWQRHALQVQQAARALIALGVKPGEAVCILGFNRPEWVIMDLAAMMVGAVAAGIYWTSAASEVEYIVEHSDCSVLLIESDAQWLRIADRHAMLARLQRVVMMEGAYALTDQQLSWDAFMAHGEDLNLQAELERRLAALGPQDLGTLIYTSGTTGPAKGVMLSHGNLSWTAQTLCRAFGVGPQDRLISYLPLAHIAEQMGAIHNPLVAGYAIYFARSMEQLSEHLLEVRPTLFFGVPRVWEKMQSAIEARLAGATGAKADLARWAMKVGRRWHETQFAARSPGLILRLHKALAARLVHGKLKQALGLDAARILISGAAPIALENLRFFSGLDLVLSEVYGQSEDCGPTTVSLPGAIRPGAVGKPLPGVALKIADDGEILVRGPNVFMGYLKQPESTLQALEEGWLHSGDLGRLDSDGFLYVTGRKKDLLITSGGKNISPGNIEAGLMNLPLVEHAVVCGEGRRFLSALLTLDAGPLADFAQRHGLGGGPAAWARDPLVLAALQAAIDEVNAGQARVAHIRKFRVLEQGLTIESGELTATLKIRRQRVLARHAELIEQMYRD